MQTNAKAGMNPVTMSFPRIAPSVAMIVLTAVYASAQPPRDRASPDGSGGATLVTGYGTNLRDQIAGGVGGAKIELIPIPPKVGAYPPNTLIVDQDIVIDALPTTTRIWFEFKVSGWDPNGNDKIDGTGVCTDGFCSAGLHPLPPTPCLIDSDCDQPTLALVAAQIVGSGFFDADLDLDGDTADDGDQLDLHPAHQQCSGANAAGHAECVAAFGEPGTTCAGTGFTFGCPYTFCCTTLFVDKTNPRPDALWAGLQDPIAASDTNSALANYRWFAATQAPEFFHDDGAVKYGATLVVDVPSGAAGRYTIPLNVAATILGDLQSPPADIPLVEESGASIRVRGCDANNQCNDNDACTQNQCNVSLGACSFPPIPGFDPLVHCCDSASGIIRAREDFDDCTDDVCSLPNGRGVPLHPISPDTTACNDLQQCTLDDHCDGANSQADGGCVGDSVSDLACVSDSDCETLTGIAYSCVSGFCECVEDPGTIVWDADPLSETRSTRALTLGVTATAAAPPFTAIQVRLVDLQSPNPPNAPCCPSQDFGTYESATCTAPGEGNSCVRWLGPPTRIPESQDEPGIDGTFLAARLQCEPYYTDWTTLGTITILGPEIMPSSSYELTSFATSCQGMEAGCIDVSSPVQMLTRRSGDVAAPWNPPSTTTQPDPQDVVAVLNKFRNQPGSPSKAFSQIQPALVELNIDIGALDIVASIDAFRGTAYPFSGPCPCPSLVTCDATACSSPSPCAGGTCVKTCIGGPQAGQPCLNDQHCNNCVGGAFDGLPCSPAVAGDCVNAGGDCPSVGICPITGFCRDRCGRCSP